MMKLRSTLWNPKGALSQARKQFVNMKECCSLQKCVGEILILASVRPNIEMHFLNWALFPLPSSMVTVLDLFVFYCSLLGEGPKILFR